ncbi:MAG: BspA family leucine-rich repeat surface protein [bacterium]|nr:BspA family leucine-rich repeat surface protein [bacterium]
MKKGFTLIELLGVVIILALLVIITFPTVINFIKKSNDVIDDATLNLVYSALDNYINENENDFEKNNNLNSCVSFDDLIESGFLKEDLISNLDASIINNKSINVSFNDKYNYNIVDNSECKLTENQIKKIVNAYAVKIENEVKAKSLENPDVNYDGFYSISNEGQTLTSTLNTLRVSDVTDALTAGTIRIEDSEVTSITNGILKSFGITVSGDNIASYPISNTNSILAADFNAKIKKLVNGLSSASIETKDTVVKYIYFLPSGMMPDGYTKESLNQLAHTSVSTIPNHIVAYFDSNNTSVYVVSDNNIYLNESSGSIFKNFKVLEYIYNLEYVNTSLATNMSSMFYNCNNLVEANLANFNTSKVTSMSSMFYNCNNLTKAVLDSFDTSKVKDISSMFNRCSVIESIDFKGFDTSQVTNMSSMFYECIKLVNLDLSSFNTSKVTNMSSMFYSCKVLPTLNLNHFDTSQVANMSNMFYNCASLTELLVVNFNTHLVTNMSSMFNRTRKLTELNLSSFYTPLVTNMSSMFYECGAKQIYMPNIIFSSVTNYTSMFTSVPNNINIEVKDEAAKLFIESRLADVGKTGNVTYN